VCCVPVWVCSQGGAIEGGGPTADGSKSPSRLGAVVHSRLSPSPPPNSSRPPVVLSPHRPHALGVGGSVFNISLFEAIHVNTKRDLIRLPIAVFGGRQLRQCRKADGTWDVRRPTLSLNPHRALLCCDTYPDGLSQVLFSIPRAQLPFKRIRRVLRAKCRSGPCILVGVLLFDHHSRSRR
jgi:hypothetical protein